MKKVYIAGPMTGLPNYNQPAFHEAAAKLEALGLAVLNPATSFGGRVDLDYPSYMRAAVMLLLQADAIVMLPGWEASKGATLELRLAVALGMETHKLENVT
jgi:hypothetical protein